MSLLKFPALALLCAATALCLAGCEAESELGGPGARDTTPATPGDGDDMADTENTFTLTVPSGEVDIDPGGSQTITVGIERGDDFDQTVTVSVMAAAEFLTVSPKEITFSGDVTEAELTLSAAATAMEGETNVTLIGKPATGRQVEQGITVHVHDEE